MRYLLLISLLLLMYCIPLEKKSKDIKKSIDAITAASVDTQDWLPEPGDSYKVLGYNDGLKGVLIKYSDEMYRGGDMLSVTGAQLLKERGIKTVFSVTPSEAIRSYCQSYGFDLHEIVFDYQKMSEEQVKYFIAALDSVETPMFIHCHSGKQRGGNLGFIYRVYVESWDLDKAMNEYGALGGKVEPDTEMLTMAYKVVQEIKR